MGAVVGRLPGTLLAGLLIVCFQPALGEWFKQHQDIMGTRVSVELWHIDPQQARRCSEAVFADMRRIDELMSTYKPASEVSVINRDAAVVPVSVSTELFDLLQAAQKFSRLSNGAFDVTFAGVGQHYDYRQHRQPDALKLDRALPAVDYHGLVLRSGTVAFRRPGMRIDLGGIAKGHAVDRAIALLDQCGIERGLVSAGGDSRILGDRGGRPWMMGIQHPRDEDGLALAIPLTDSAISTSGDYERFFFHNGERIHHIINPQTGRPATQAWSVSVIGPDATSTDALSTTLFVLGVEKALQLIETLPEFDAVVIDADGEVHYSSGLKNPLGIDG